MESFVWLWKTEYFVYCEAGLYISKFYNFFPGLLQEDIFPQINLFPEITLLSSFVPFFLLYSSHFLPLTMFSFLFSFIFLSSLFLSLAIFVFFHPVGKIFFQNIYAFSEDYHMRLEKKKLRITVSTNRFWTELYNVTTKNLNLGWKSCYMMIGN